VTLIEEGLRLEERVLEHIDAVVFQSARVYARAYSVRVHPIAVSATLISVASTMFHGTRNEAPARFPEFDALLQRLRDRWRSCRSQIRAREPRGGTGTHSLGRSGIGIFLIRIASRTLFSMA
jgi:hypothetical protein